MLVPVLILVLVIVLTLVLVLVLVLVLGPRKVEMQVASLKSEPLAVDGESVPWIARPCAICLHLVGSKASALSMGNGTFCHSTCGGAKRSLDRMLVAHAPLKTYIGQLQRTDHAAYMAVVNALVTDDACTRTVGQRQVGMQLF